MANTKQAKKRIRQNHKRRLTNKWQTSRMNTHLRKCLAQIQTGDQAAAQDAYRAAVSLVDKMVSKGMIHKNKAARHKSRLNKQLKTLAA